MSLTLQVILSHNKYYSPLEFERTRIDRKRYDLTFRRLKETFRDVVKSFV